MDRSTTPGLASRTRLKIFNNLNFRNSRTASGTPSRLGEANDVRMPELLIEKEVR
jgi:hypothetical protein